VTHARTRYGSNLTAGSSWDMGARASCRGQSGSACQVRNLPDGGGSCPVSAVPSDPRTDKTTRRAVAEGRADMTSANRLPAQPTTKGLRCQCVPTPAEAARWASKLHLFCHDSPLRACCRTQIRLWGFAFNAGGLYWSSNDPAAESGERYLGNVG